MKRLVIVFAGIATLGLAVQADAGPRPTRKAAQIVKDHALDRKPTPGSTDRDAMAEDIANELGDTPLCVCKETLPGKIGRLIVEPPTKNGRPFKALCGIMLYDAEGDIDGATPCMGDYEVL